MTKDKASHNDFPWLKSYPENIKWDQHFPAAPLFTLLDETVQKYPERRAIEFLGKTYSYLELDNLVNRAAKGLQNLGVKKGTHVGLFLPNAPCYVIFYYAILKAGGTIVNFSPLYVDREISAQIEDSETDIMVTLDLEALFPKVASMLLKTRLKHVIVCPLKEQLPFPKNILFPILKPKEVATVTYNDRVIAFKDIINNDGCPEPVQINPETDIALIQYTGGTTGIPKGAMLTHKNVYVNVHQADAWYDRDRNKIEKILAALPLFHVFAMTAIMNLAIKCGAEIIMMFPRFNPEDAMKMIEKHKITFFPAVPTIYSLISNHSLVQKYDLSSIIACLSGGAPLPLEVKREFEAVTGCIVVEAYGLSETSPAAICNPLHGVNKEGSIGLPFPGTTIKIMSLENPVEEVALGEKGEICIYGPQVMQGYWNRPVETSSCLVDGVFHTGDVGYMDKEGYTFLVDRIKDLIICSGYNVYPRVIEEAIYLHPAVEETTVIGVPDVKRGESPKAFIKLKKAQSLTEQEMFDFLKDKLSPIEMPKHIEFRDQLPKTIIGKLSKKELIDEERKR